MTPYALRRLQLASQLDSDSVAIIVGNIEQVRNLNISYPFHQDNDFYYLTGFNEPDCVCVIRPGHDTPYVMFARDNDSYQEVQFGARAGLKGLEQNHSVDKAIDISEFEGTIISLFEKRHKLYISDNHGRFHNQLGHWLTARQPDHAFDSVKVYRSIHQLSPMIAQMRVIKDEHELSLIKQAAEASINGHIAVMKACAPDINERVLSATFNRTISDYGCDSVGYGNIVASGNNGICLHYEDNNQLCKDGDMVLTDLGGEYQHYTADISRTFPVNGKFSDAQAALYQIVLNALDASISLVKPGAKWNTLFEANQRVLAQGLLDLGILSGDIEDILANEAQREFTVHKTGHWMGLHVHDVGSYQLPSSDEWTVLEPNMVFTIEPGVYIPADCDKVDEKWRGIAIRIEDDILVTEDGFINLTERAPRTIAEIEACMAESHS
ncbi:aminopeptidase P family protein [Psychrobium sp. MM17-31]|uniref:aminopeptidase P family protein n=1 Tax=Psychrobium sp. MM17-31 TaxID=2917758 RepID=UPI001EF6E115|nr:aminopeptidase P family protein [Psychrobium sp. MM17-31]MCG7530779.1 aminopeptidase P family protein [Psychrobium sp. MM17-31]